VPALDQRVEGRSLSELTSNDEPLVVAATVIGLRVLGHITSLSVIW
jgi:hypothetical protein